MRCKAGDCATATRLLTRPFAVEGVVQHGDKRGRTLGYPTANLELGNYLRPPTASMRCAGGSPTARVLNGAANLGIRPSFDPPKELLEALFLRFRRRSCTAQTIEVALHRLHPARGEVRRAWRR